MAKNKPSQEEMLSKWGETCRVFEYPVPTWMSRRLCTKGGEKLKSIMAQANLNHIWYNNHYYTPGQFEDFVKLYSNDWEKIQQAIKIIDEIQVQEEKLPEWSDKLKLKTKDEILKFEIKNPQKRPQYQQTNDGFPPLGPGQQAAKPVVNPIQRPLRPIQNHTSENKSIKDTSIKAKDDQDDGKSESGSSGIFSENSRPNSKANTEGPSFELVENAFQQLMQFKEETESAFRNFNSLKEENEKLRNQLNMANKQLKVTVDEKEELVGLNLQLLEEQQILKSMVAECKICCERRIAVAISCGHTLCEMNEFHNFWYQKFGISLI